LLICGDFQALRSEDDYESLAVPPKYQSMESFYKYYKVGSYLRVSFGFPHAMVLGYTSLGLATDSTV